MKRFRWITVALLGTLLFSAGCAKKTESPAPAPQKEAPKAAAPAAGDKPPVKIGFVVSFTGAYAALAEDQWRGAQLAAEEINAAGGILGRKIAFVTRDDKLNTGEAAKVTQELIQSEKPDLIVGSMGAATALAINEQAKKANIPFVGISQSNQLNKAPDFGEYTFHEALTPYMNAQATGKWVVENLGKKVYFLMPDYAFGKENYESYSKLVKDSGATELGVTWFPLGTTDFTPYVAKIRAAKPDVIISSALGADQVNMVKQLVSFGITKETKLFIGVVDLQSDKAMGFQNLAGVYGGMSFYWEMAEKNPSAKKFVDAYQKKWNAPPSGYAAYGYSGTYMLKQAAEKASSIEAAKISKAMEGMKYDFYKGEQFVRACDHQAFQPVYIAKGRTADEAKAAGKGEYGFREIIGVVQPAESLERSCADLGLANRK